MELIKQAEAHIRELLHAEGTGHDWYHIDRVRKLALFIARGENADPYVTELGALLHDIADHKFHGGDHEIGHRTARTWLEEHGADTELVRKVGDIVERVSFSANKGPMTSVEGKCVQDADRIEALGAIGIARCFATGGKFKRPIHDPQNPKDTSIQHFYDKLLLLRDRMNTESGRKIATERHQFMEAFLKEFYTEWDVKGL
jgi:uncharacterized protein